MDPILSDHDLLIAIAAGNRPAFEILASRHHGLVRVACQRQGVHADQGDCVQAVFLELLRKADQAQRAPALPAWLLTVARHVCATARRAHDTRKRAEHAAGLTTLAGASAPIAATHDAAEHLDDCLARLPERQRTVITQHYLAGISRDQVADDLGIDIATVHQHCHRGLARLRELLGRRGVAVPATGLIALLAAQAQAATTPMPFTYEQSII